MLHHFLLSACHNPFQRNQRREMSGG